MNNSTETNFSAEATTKEQKKNKFEQAEKFPLFDENGNQLKNWFGVRNPENHNQVYTTVTSVYKVLNHDEAYNKMTQALEEMLMEYNVKWKRMNDGARYRWYISFPNSCIQLGEANELINCEIAIDNSYDKSTGVRNTISGIYKGRRLPSNKNFGYHYARHTDSMDVEDLKKTMVKGIEGFEKAVAEKWQKYYDTNIDQKVLLEKVIDLLEQKKAPAKKYLKEFISKLKREDYKNVWEVYNMVCEVLTLNQASVDTYDRVANYMDSWLQRNLQSIKL